MRARVGEGVSVSVFEFEFEWGERGRGRFAWRASNGLHVSRSREPLASLEHELEHGHGLAHARRSLSRLPSPERLPA